jgi:hypothetical protein
MLNRRSFLQTSAVAASCPMLAPWLQSALGAPAVGKPPRRFIFLHKGNGLIPSTLVPTSLSTAEQEKENRKEALNVDLAKQQLPEWMKPITAHVSNMTILQGLSGKMCTTGHHTWQSSLGVYRANEKLTSIKWATVDFELARMFPSPLEHIELACFPNGGGNGRGNINGIETGFSARGPQTPNLAYGSPKIALRELFKLVSNSAKDQTDYKLKQMVWEFTAGQQSALAEPLTGGERAKVATYADSIAESRARDGRLEQMIDRIRKHLPQLDAKYLSDDITTINRQWGHLEILLATLISGMTNVVTFTLDELGTPYTGLKGIESEVVNLHDVGHNKSFGGASALEIRAKVRTQHMAIIDSLITRLKAVPEADGNMFDNTTILYFPDNGETHHSTGVEWPYMIFAGRNSKLNTAGRYIRLPAHGREGHKTIGNLYTTLLNAYGNPVSHYGDLDLALDKMKIPQKGAIREFVS